MKFESATENDVESQVIVAKHASSISKVWPYRPTATGRKNVWPVRTVDHSRKYTWAKMVSGSSAEDSSRYVAVLSRAFGNILRACFAPLNIPLSESH